MSFGVIKDQLIILPFHYHMTRAQSGASAWSQLLLTSISILGGRTAHVKYSNQTASFNTHVAWICFLGAAGRSRFTYLQQKHI